MHTYSHAGSSLYLPTEMGEAEVTYKCKARPKIINIYDAIMMAEKVLK